MQEDENDPADGNRGLGPIDGSHSSRVQLSTNTTRRLQKLARWRIDPSLITFLEGAANYEGGYAIVSRALVGSSPDDTRDHLVDSGSRKPMSGNPTAELEGDNGRREETTGLWKTVAVKKMKVKTKEDITRVLGLTLREAEFLVELSHENIIELEGFVEDLSKEMIWLIFPWEDNGNLKNFIDSHDWEIPERISLIADVARGVEYLHGRKPPICHGDLKSINVLVNSKYRAVITDFGSARNPVAKSPNKEKGRDHNKEAQPAPSLEATHCPSTNTVTLTCNQYTLRWAAPELLEDDDANLASDIWALGCVAYEVMTNSIPFQDVKDAIVIKRVVRGDLPSISSEARMLLIQALCTLVKQCWNVDPGKRPTANECLRALTWMPMIIPSPARTADTASFVEHSPELLMKLGKMHGKQNDYSNAFKYYTKALDVYTDLNDSNGKASALRQLAQVHRIQKRYSDAVTFGSAALKIYTDIDDRDGRAAVLFSLAEVHRSQNEGSQAVALYSEALQIWTDMGKTPEIAAALSGLARMHEAQQEYSQAAALHSKCLQTSTSIGDRRGEANALQGLAKVHLLRNEYDQAVTFFSEALRISTDIGSRRRRAHALRSLAKVHLLRKEYNQAVTFYSEVLQISTDIGDGQGRAEALLGLGDVHRAEAQHSDAIHYYEQAAEVSKQTGNTRKEAYALQKAAEVRHLMAQMGAA